MVRCYAQGVEGAKDRMGEPVQRTARDLENNAVGLVCTVLYVPNCMYGPATINKSVALHKTR
jgi:hypothetical protein